MVAETDDTPIGATAGKLATLVRPIASPLVQSEIPKHTLNVGIIQTLERKSYEQITIIIITKTL